MLPRSSFFRSAISRCIRLMVVYSHVSHHSVVCSKHGILTDEDSGGGMLKVGGQGENDARGLIFGVGKQVDKSYLPTHLSNQNRQNGKRRTR